MMRNYEFLDKHGQTADRILEWLAGLFLAFVAGSVFGYAWAVKAYGILN